MIYVSSDKSQKYGDKVRVVEFIFPAEDGMLEALQAQYDHAVLVDIPTDNVWGCPNALVIDTDARIEGDPDTPVVVVRPKGDFELLVDAKERTLEILDSTTNDLIKSVANTDRQNSLSLMYNNMSTTDKSRAKTYFDWHKSMLAKHYELKSAISSVTTAEELALIVGNDIAENFTALMAAAPVDAVDLSSYIH